ncbi:MAG: DUF2330 domain-containing protein [Deltaproteobacteria bacterium]|nr:DUF2330 domain-containing protein [Deltaproteobacteria bacterium]
MRPVMFALGFLGALATPALALGFCGFYVSGSSGAITNKATRVALMRQGTRTVLTMSNDYDGPAADFAMIVPVPIVLQQENVRTLPHDVFNHLESVTAPRLVEYWEQDPCYRPPMRRPRWGRGEAAMPTAAAPMEDMVDSPTVRIEARFTVGEYNVLVLSATESTGLETWLRANHYNIPNGAAEALAPYVREQWTFFVARVDIARAERRASGGVRLSPLRFHYDAPEFRLPVRLGLLNAPQAQDLIVYVIHPTSRFEVANYHNAFVPTNLTVTNSVRSHFGEFYARLFDYTLDASGGRSVITEYAWSTGSCDPCPSPPLDASELTVLGADVLGGADTSYHGGVMVVTRLHTRYDRSTLSEDLIFREAPPIAGGRETPGTRGGVEQGASPSGVNNFQARYAIRHPWTGPITCAHPRRGVWGAPPRGVHPHPVAARDLAEVPRGRLSLRANLRSPLPVVRPPGAAGGSGPHGSNSHEPTQGERLAGGAGLAGLLGAVLRRMRG